jgi:glycosyltransferase involved in cell wall biosynthesis
MDLKNLDVLLFNPSIENGGVEKNLYIFSKLFRKKVKTISIVSSSIEKKKLFDRKIKFISFNKVKIKSNKRFVHYVFSIFALINFFVKNKNKKILIISFQSNVLSILTAKLFCKKIIIRLNTSPNKYINNIFKKLFFKLIYNMSDLIVVNSYSFKKEVKSLFNLKSHVIYNLIKKIKLKKKIKNELLEIINVGRITDQKDQITLLRAIKLVNNYINCNLSIVGKGYLQGYLKNYVIKNKLKNINFLGPVDSPERLIAKSDLFILTSKYEGMPNVLIEAMQCKTYIISTNCKTGPKELLNNGKYGSLVPVGSHVSIAKEILKYAKKPLFYKGKINMGHKSLNRFDNNKNILIYANLILELK